MSKFQKNITNYLTTHNIKLVDDISNITTREKSMKINLICPQQHEFTSTITCLATCSSRGLIPSCKICKSLKLKEKHEELSPYNIINADKLIECKDCKLTYHYNNINMKCFCKLKTKQKELVFYKSLIKIFPEYEIEREFHVCAGKKVDVHLENDEYSIYIEIDDRQHFYPSSKRYKQDIEITEMLCKAVNGNGKKNIIIRIDDSLITNETSDEYVNKIKTALCEANGNVLITYGKNTNYKHIRERIK